MNHPERKPKLTPLTFEEVVDIAAEATLRDGYHDPTFIIDGTQQVIFARPQSLADTPEERWRQMFLLGGDVAAVSGAGKPRGVFFVAQSLMLRLDNRDRSKAASPPSPSRLEVLVISGYDMATQKIKTTLFELLRDEGGPIHDLLELRIEQDNADPADTPLLMAFVEGLGSGAGE